MWMGSSLIHSSSSQVSWKSVPVFFGNLVHNQTCEPTVRQIDREADTSSLAEVKISLKNETWRAEASLNQKLSLQLPTAFLSQSHRGLILTWWWFASLYLTFLQQHPERRGLTRLSHYRFMTTGPLSYLPVTNSFRCGEAVSRAKVRSPFSSCSWEQKGIKVENPQRWGGSCCTLSHYKPLSSLPRSATSSLNVHIFF